MNEKRLFIIFVLIAGALLGAVATVSYVENPGGDFTQNIYEEGVANILLSGHNVGNIGNYDERLLQKDLINTDQRQIDVIVLGSSRSMQISSSAPIGQVSKGQIFFNHAVSDASIEDDIALLDLYLEKGSSPKTILIGVDPWILNANNQQWKWVSLRNEYLNGIARIFSMPVPSERNPENISSSDISPSIGFYLQSDINRYVSLISRPIIITSIIRLVNNQNQTSYFQTNLEESNVAIKLKDGSLSYPATIRDRTVEQIDKDATDYANVNLIHSLGNFTQIDEKSKIQFESTIRYLKSRNATVILFLPPYHPIVYNKITSDPKYSLVKDVESYFKEFGSIENITIVGSYDPHRLNLTSMDFYDGIHPKREAIDKIFVAGGL